MTQAPPSGQEPPQDDVGRRNRDCGARQGCARGRRLAEHLDHEPRPIRVEVDLCTLRAVQAWPFARLHQRAEVHTLVAEHDSQVRYIRPEPVRRARGGDSEVRDQDG
ncbi:hypothetical protein [Rathayibacter iranicus]|uniref:hypothetical protein n=1 Tax=Rathayibacter iranicus TaxID=59737 RepID=UPI000FD6F1C5|nr:hypothetical protein [Rathayibacter iranicus]